jgi:hypothetical protein
MVLLSPREGVDTGMGRLYSAGFSARVRWSIRGMGWPLPQKIFIFYRKESKKEELALAVG